ncbi:Holliday junction branch migration protein RuvA [Paucilactobacillus sp. N302-9]
MYEYLTGIVAAINPGYVVLDVNGVGYKLFSANPYHYQVDANKSVTIYVYQAVRENEMTLFGLKDAAEKQLFEQLINVSGIGPKSALAILANDDHSGLVNAITNDDPTYLTKFPGVGKKTASQIVLDLKNKLGKIDLGVDPQLTNLDSTAAQSDNPQLNDALDALSALGYRERDVNKVAKALIKIPETNTDGYLRQALKLLTK